MTKTVSLETAKKLKEAGWPQGKERFTARYCLAHGEKLNCPLRSCFPADKVDAPDVSELLEALPNNTRLIKDVEGYYGFIEPDGFKDWASTLTATGNPAEALASLWLELKA